MPARYNRHFGRPQGSPLQPTTDHRTFMGRRDIIRRAKNSGPPTQIAAFRTFYAVQW